MANPFQNTIDSIGVIPKKARIEVTVGDTVVSAWESASVTCGIERIPRTFSLQTSYEFVAGYDGGVMPDYPIQAPVKIRIYEANETVGQLVLTGYIEGCDNNLSDGEHSLVYSGRGASCDLVDCMAGFSVDDANALMQVSIFEAIKRIGSVYDIDVRLEPNITGTGTTAAVTSSKLTGNLTLSLTDNAYTVIEQLARMCNVLLFEAADGSLLVSVPGSSRTDTVLNHQNCLTSEVHTDTSILFAEYKVYCAANIADQQNFSLAGVASYKEPYFSGKQTPKGNPRVRVYRTQADILLTPEIYAQNGQRTSQQILADWLGSHSRGKSQIVTVTVQGWKADDGGIWKPNQLVEVLLPYQNIAATLLVVGCVYSVSVESGTTTRLLLQSPAAFAVEPTGQNDPIRNQTLAPSGTPGH